MFHWVYAGMIYWYPLYLVHPWGGILVKHNPEGVLLEIPYHEIRYFCSSVQNILTVWKNKDEIWESSAQEHFITKTV